MRACWAILALSAIGCGGEPGPPDAAAALDANIAEDAPIAIDAGVDGAGSGCGDARVDPGEACDGAALDCAELGAIFTSGSAPCRTDCRGWETAGCERRPGLAREMVMPALRDAARWGDARCNDGTPFGFVIRPATPPSSDWVIYLQGGVYCDDLSLSCAERRMRSRDLTTTPPIPDGATMAPPFGGLLSLETAVNPDFAGANQVLAFYCSSDFWSGASTERRPTAADPAGWYFSGHANVDAMIAILVERYGLDDSDGALRVLFGGGSAGAFGAHLNVARVRDALPRAAAEDRVTLLADAGWMIAWDDPGSRLGSATISDREVWRAARAFWGASFDPACEASVSDPVDCFFGPTWYPVLAARLPVFVQQCEVDSSFMGVHGLDPSAPSDASATAAWRAMHRSSFDGVAWLFSGSSPYHVLGGGDSSFATGPSGSTFRDQLGAFFRGEAAERVQF